MSKIGKSPPEVQGDYYFKRMFVLGVDPGLSRCGFGLVHAQRGKPHRNVEHGILQTSPKDPIHLRLASLMEQLDELFHRLHPSVVVVERVFFQTNARTAMGVGQASGLALALATRRGCQVHQYTSNEVKQAVAGYGAAEKYQMQEMVAKLLSLASVPKPADAADALGLALCHLAHSPAHLKTTIGSNPSLVEAGGAFGGRPLKVATNVGGVRIATTESTKGKNQAVRGQAS